MDIIKEIVYSNLNTRVENGYFLDDSLDAIVTDLRAYAFDCEEIPAEILKPHVEQWMKDNAA